MPIGLERRQSTGQLHFVTFSCYHRLPFLDSSEPKNVLERAVERARQSHSLDIYAYVLMPEHVHLLTGEPDVRTLASFLRVVKGESSKLLRGERERFWQSRYYDFNTFTTGKFVEKVQYIHRNPVTRGLVARSEDSRWSSFRHYAMGEEGVIRIASHWVDRERFALRANAHSCDETA
ncbi:MAG: transposase [Edaphobacter sp.]|uniref:REP-associated tyrosine transposase n=1 Tax=Edaphobacter sp. TaxID=1934404 RepID=UPI00239B0E65|nr:transposase [Edaphobacter sp.]MDE1178096.1 transposase [Edaphobacter sp.]